MIAPVKHWIVLPDLSQGPEFVAFVFGRDLVSSGLAVELLLVHADVGGEADDDDEEKEQKCGEDCQGNGIFKKVGTS